MQKMLFEKRSEKNFIIGFDLGDDVCQMSYCILENGSVLQDATTWSAVPGEEQFDIPTVLCKEIGANRWQYGASAAARAGDEAVTYVPHLLTQAAEDREVRIEEEIYDAEALLALFIGRCLGELHALVPEGAEQCVMFTSESMDGRMVELLENIRRRLDLTGTVLYQSHAGSYYYYMLRQEKDLREPGSVLFEYEPGGPVKICRLLCNVRSNPVVVVQEESVYPGLVAQTDAGRDEEFAGILRSELSGRSCSSVYLLGSGFRGSWMKKSVSAMCAGGRRAFLGGNLFSKGAACGAMLRMTQAPVLSEYFFLDSNKLRMNVLIRAMEHGREETITLLEAGVNWYEVGGSTDLILDGTGELNLILKPLTGGKEVPFHIRLEGLPVREGRMTRVRLNFSMHSPQKLRILIEDLGFGEIFPSGGLKWEQEITVADS